MFASFKRVIKLDYISMLDLLEYKQLLHEFLLIPLVILKVLFINRLDGYELFTKSMHG